jgi:hypothetical protein
MTSRQTAINAMRLPIAALELKTGRLIASRHISVQHV